ncbi:peptidylprolyl isomerase [Sphingopyxis sp. BSNA05]|uniref:peptidylprolyl isomerase n=1 Tax=Sphingomonadales TaxID=204457 RepID=UPI000C1F4B6D|nr:MULTISPECIES: peptidylprolyl isomerase [Sphingomonadaceae]ATW05231.1 peptidylprolyl isomerase [Sphingorhabdus sp. YGSMI21]NRD88353.1 peptidylprolyl isomerase [Sphingopyxis sp. BSNA05]
MNVLSTKIQGFKSKAILITALAIAGASPSVSQTVADTSLPQTGLDIPDELTIFGNNDPNVRRATAIVNGDIITGTDVGHRLALIVAANGGEVSDEEKQRLRLQILRNLIDETLQIQEAEANEIVIAPEEVEATFRQVAQQNFKQDLDAFDQYLRSQGSSADTLKRQIKGELAWSRLLRRNIQPFINVGDEEVNAIIERLNASKGTTEYRIGEIYMSANQENAEQVAANMVKILEQIRAGGSFVAYARQFSEASTAATGGDLGWVRPAQLPQTLAQAAEQMQVGQVVGPIEVPGGLSILYLIDSRQVLTADARDALLSLKQLAIDFPPGVTEAQASARAAKFATETQAIKGCGAANEVAARLGASVVDNDQVRLRDLPAALQGAIGQLQIGQASQPFGSVEDGVRVLILCGRDDPQSAAAPSFDAIMSRLENDRINKRAQIYLRDLRRDAIIEYN